jgi:anti-sigma factor RsiW
MRCEDLTDDVLVDLVDGGLEPVVRGEVERHLEGCAICRALVMDLRTIRAAAFTLNRPEPRPEVWASVKTRLAREPRPSVSASVVDIAPRRSPLLSGPIRWRPWLAAAAVLLAATFVSLLPLMRSSSSSEAPAQAPAPPASPSVESIAAEFEAAEAHYQKAITDLETIAREGSGTLDPQVAAVLQKNLTLIDQAISESRAALGTQPSSASAQTGLFDALRTKLALLQETVELINEMRQGNQAEAGRALQSLSR